MYLLPLHVVSGMETTLQVGEGSTPASALTVTYPGSEYPKTYQSGAPTGLWRFHPMDPTAPDSAFAVVVALGQLAAPDTGVTPLHATIDWATRASLAYYSPRLRTDISIVSGASATIDCNR